MQLLPMFYSVLKKETYFAYLQSEVHGNIFCELLRK